MANFLPGHVAAFDAWNGVARVLLYDNLKSAVLERQGDAIRFHPTLLALAAHYRLEPRPVAVARGNEKGRVERAIRYVREAFFAARTWQDLDAHLDRFKPLADFDWTWPKRVERAAVVVSLIDRLVHHAEIIAIEGESYRLKEAKEHAEQRRRQRAAPQVTTPPTADSPTAGGPNVSPTHHPG